MANAELRLRSLSRPIRQVLIDIPTLAETTIPFELNNMSDEPAAK